MRLTPHFSLSEFDCHDGTPAPRHAADDLRALCLRFLEPLRRAYGPVRIISGYRTRRYNVAVNGAPSSYHIYLATRAGVAADVAAARGRPADWHAFLERRRAPGLGAYKDHVHVDNRAGRARW